MSKYQRILYDYARPTWRWEDPLNRNGEKRLRWLKDEAFANSKHKYTYDNTRRAFIRNRKLDMSLEKNVSFLSKKHGRECCLIEHNQKSLKDSEAGKILLDSHRRKSLNEIRKSSYNLSAETEKTRVQAILNQSVNANQPDTKYIVHRHYYEPENLFSNTGFNPCNVFSTVGKVDLLQWKLNSDNTVQCAKPVVTTKYV